MSEILLRPIHNGYCKFFRARLLTASPEKIAKIIEQMEKEIKLIKKDCLKMSWGMRGGVSYTELLNMSATERELIADIIKDNLEITKKSKLPYF